MKRPSINVLIILFALIFAMGCHKPKSSGGPGPGPGPGGGKCAKGPGVGEDEDDDEDEGNKRNLAKDAGKVDEALFPDGIPPVGPQIAGGPGGNIDGINGLENPTDVSGAGAGNTGVVGSGTGGLTPSPGVIPLGVARSRDQAFAPTGQSGGVIRRRSENGPSVTMAPTHEAAARPQVFQETGRSFRGLTGPGTSVRRPRYVNGSGA